MVKKEILVRYVQHLKEEKTRARQYSECLRRLKDDILRKFCDLILQVNY